MIIGGGMTGVVIIYGDDDYGRGMIEETTEQLELIT